MSYAAIAPPPTRKRPAREPIRIPGEPATDPEHDPFNPDRFRPQSPTDPRRKVDPKTPRTPKRTAELERILDQVDVGEPEERGYGAEPVREPLYD